MTVERYTLRVVRTDRGVQRRRPAADYLRTVSPSVARVLDDASRMAACAAKLEEQAEAAL